jgi:fused signal recognition particle receptor
MIFKKNKSSEATPGLWQRLRSGLDKTRAILFTDLGELFNLKNHSRAELLEEVENRLLMADVGIESTAHIIRSLEQAMQKNRINSAQDLVTLLHDRMVELLKPVEVAPLVPDGPRPFTLLVVGVNGAGKTTTIGKLANLYKQDYKVVLAAGDTFRAAAIEQLQSWGDRIHIPVIAHAQGGDSSAVIYDSLQAARDQHADILIADTAGRLQNKNNLIEELKKIRRTINKFDPAACVETLLVLDASNGQNALAQAQQFHEAIGITGIILTKLDGTAKGGIIFAIASKLGIPIRFLGTGEKITDLSPFVAENFVKALLSTEP